MRNYDGTDRRPVCHPTVSAGSGPTRSTSPTSPRSGPTPGWRPSPRARDLAEWWCSAPDGLSEWLWARLAARSPPPGMRPRRFRAASCAATGASCGCGWPASGPGTRLLGTRRAHHPSASSRRPDDRGRLRSSGTRWTSRCGGSGIGVLSGRELGGIGRPALGGAWDQRLGQDHLVVRSPGPASGRPGVGRRSLVSASATSTCARFGHGCRSSAAR